MKEKKKRERKRKTAVVGTASVPALAGRVADRTVILRRQKGVDNA